MTEALKKEEGKVFGAHLADTVDMATGYSVRAENLPQRGTAISKSQRREEERKDKYSINLKMSLFLNWQLYESVSSSQPFHSPAQCKCMMMTPGLFGIIMASLLIRTELVRSVRFSLKQGCFVLFSSVLFFPFLILFLFENMATFSFVKFVLLTKLAKLNCLLWLHQKSSGKNPSTVLNALQVRTMLHPAFSQFLFTTAWPRPLWSPWQETYWLE